MFATQVHLLGSGELLAGLRDQLLHVAAGGQEEGGHVHLQRHGLLTDAGDGCIHVMLVHKVVMAQTLVQPCQQKSIKDCWLTRVMMVHKVATMQAKKKKVIRHYTMLTESCYGAPQSCSNAISHSALLAKKHSSITDCWLSHVMVLQKVTMMQSLVQSCQQQVCTHNRLLIGSCCDAAPSGYDAISGWTLPVEKHSSITDCWLSHVMVLHKVGMIKILVQTCQQQKYACMTNCWLSHVMVIYKVTMMRSLVQPC